MVVETGTVVAFTRHMNLQGMEGDVQVIGIMLGTHIVDQWGCFYTDRWLFYKCGDFNM